MDNEVVQYVLVGVFFLLLAVGTIRRYRRARKRGSGGSCCSGCISDKTTCGGCDQCTPASRKKQRNS